MKSPILHRGAAMCAAWLGVTLLVGCSSDSISEADPVTEYTMVLDAPAAPISAAVLDLVNVDSVTAVDGDVIARRRGDVLRAIVLLRKPGRLSVRVSVPLGAGPPSGMAVAATDGADRVVDSLEGAHLRIEP